MGSALTNILAFVAAISILVAVHEYGHYIVGRWTGMKVLRFSIGFGRPIWKHVGGKDQTEYCLSAIPLGGYVKFLDSREAAVAAEDDGRAFDQRPILARIAVLLAGPAFNFVFAILAYWALLSGGIIVAKPAIGVVQADSYAAAAGLEYGDRIIAVGDQATAAWEPALFAILGEMVDDGRVPLTLLGSDGRQRQTVIDVGADKTRLTEPGVLFDGLGFSRWRPPAVIGELTDDGAAVAAGLAVGDAITGIDDEVVTDFFALQSIVTPLAGKNVVVHYSRAGREGSVRLTVGEVVEGGKARGVLGILGGSVLDSDYYERRAYSPLESLQAGVSKTWDSTVFTVQMLSRMVTGDVSIKNISGPINIAQFAGESAERGLSVFIGFLAVVSISLGILNLLPIPVLDGGQIVYQLVEAVKGSPLTERAQILGQQVGIFALLLLMSFAFYNDIARLLD